MRRGIRSRWTRNGAIAGVVILLADLTGWRGEKFAPWDGIAVYANLGVIVGYVVGGSFLFLIAAIIRQAITKEP